MTSQKPQSDAARWMFDYSEKQRLLDPAGWAAYRKKHRDKSRDQPGYQEKTRAARKAWELANPEKVRAHQKVKDALRSARLVRPDSCERCKKFCKPQATHDDYSKPLQIEWLCQSCHKFKDSPRRREE